MLVFNQILLSVMKRRHSVIQVARFITQCAKELPRYIKELGFVGALIDNHANGTSL